MPPWPTLSKGRGEQCSRYAPPFRRPSVCRSILFYDVAVSKTHVLFTLCVDVLVLPFFDILVCDFSQWLGSFSLLCFCLSIPWLRSFAFVKCVDENPSSPRRYGSGVWWTRNIAQCRAPTSPVLWSMAFTISCVYLVRLGHFLPMKRRLQILRLFRRSRDLVTPEVTFLVIRPLLETPEWL